MPTYPQYYFTSSGANAGLYVDPVDGSTVDSRDRCGMLLQIPCNFTLNKQYIDLRFSDSPCIFNWCTLINAIKSIAGSELIQADVQSSDLTLTADQISVATQNATLLLA